ncbi:glycosyl hydrolase [Streptomyces anulatus]|uniref:glycosyl hydrolase n=1 Tax=Streptomyces anulatus TaxID=1892 RepID=UPI0004C56EA5|nr:glycosyl hydrolase [Streptomyces anulatus]
MNTELDFRLDDLVPADADSEYAEQQFWSGDLTVLTEHHTAPHGSHSYVVAHDGSVTWGVPGEPQVAAIKVARNLSLNTFTMETTYHATVPFAQNWLIEQGCPPEQMAEVGAEGATPADDLTVRIEAEIRESGTRYEVIETDTSDYDPCEAWTLTRDSDTVQEPIRLFLQEWDINAHTYTLREGAFADEETALRWLDDRSTPLPQPPGHIGEAAALRTRAALARSAGSSEIPRTASGTHQPAAAVPVQRSVQGRLL